MMSWKLWDMLIDIRRRCEMVQDRGKTRIVGRKIFYDRIGGFHFP
jgi:hypothetical protein